MVYEYTQLANIQPGNVYNLYGIVKNFSCGIKKENKVDLDNLKVIYTMLIIDESCMKDSVNAIVSYEILVRLVNGQIFNGAVCATHIDGTLQFKGEPGFSVIAFAPFKISRPENICFVTSKNVKFEKFDEIRIEQLKLLSKKINLNDTFEKLYINDKKLYFEINFVNPINKSKNLTTKLDNANLSNSSVNKFNATYLCEQNATKPCETLIRNNSFDTADFKTQVRQNVYAVANELTKSLDINVSDKNLDLNDDLLSNEIANKICLQLQEYQENNKLPFVLTPIKHIQAKVRGTYFNTICQVVAVLFLKDDCSRVFLRVTDGTILASSKPLNRITNDRVDKERSLFLNSEIYNCIQKHCVDITCFDEYAEKVKNCTPGDIVLLINVRAHELDAVISLKLNGNGERFQRDLKILKKTCNNRTDKLVLPMSSQTLQTSTSFVETDDFFEEDATDMKLFPVPESLFSTPVTKRSRIMDESFVSESP